MLGVVLNFGGTNLGVANFSGLNFNAINLAGSDLSGLLSPLRFMIFPFGGISFILFFVFSLLLYFLPSVVAFRRNHRNSMAILLLNIFLGWTFIGWIISLIWSFTSPSPQMVVVQQTPYIPYPVAVPTPYPETQRGYAPVGQGPISPPQTYVQGSRPPEILPPENR